MISALKTTFSLNNFKILRPKVQKKSDEFAKDFCESQPRVLFFIS